ncbi:LLM class flavin-dependent oxidoreductase [Altererythrobacter salegens]|uniref:LLM class flavin-dependent oxidoreductase n=1 Tax=Croceibacterium salegens TaxID=1737568 RepID=A0A6I4SX52_9SPHN|nr:LLM class flavin-dependent oxidoreductase [Croceibacterium salegens]MXO60664.1 LLM class flavin-dependent oxidoreductase [Croceibacterium salegens]
MIKVWDFDFNQVPGKAAPDYDDHEVVQRAFDHNLDLMVSLEGRGFEGVFYSEHHFIAAMSPCPNLLIAALAAKTEKMKIGVMGNVLAFHQPWRLAEELNMLDYLTHGRLEVGVASGVPPEFRFVGIPVEDVRPMYIEVLDFLQSAYERKFVTLKGKFFDLEAVPVMPRPRKEQRRRHWMTIYSERSCRDAAQRNFKVCTGYQPVETAAIAFDAYREEAAQHGRSVGPDDIGVRRQVLIWDTQADAEALAAELEASNKARMASIFQDMFARLAKEGVAIQDAMKPAGSVKDSGVMDAAAVPRAEKNLTPGAPKVDPTGALQVSPDEYITGSPESVAEQIIDQCRRLGAGNIMAYHAPTMDEAQIARNYALWEKVIPIVNKADVLKAPAAA